jgi:hypothetical protein
VHTPSAAQIAAARQAAAARAAAAHRALLARQRTARLAAQHAVAARRAYLAAMQRAQAAIAEAQRLVAQQQAAARLESEIGGELGGVSGASARAVLPSSSGTLLPAGVPPLAVIGLLALGIAAAAASASRILMRSLLAMGGTGLVSGLVMLFLLAPR